jgi:hypothetical protein
MGYAMLEDATEMELGDEESESPFEYVQDNLVFGDEEDSTPHSATLPCTALESVLSRKRQAELRISLGASPKRAKGITQPLPSFGPTQAHLDHVGESMAARIH